MNLLMRFPEGKKKAVTLSYDDGVVSDIRLMEVLNKYGLKCTFNINTGTFFDEGECIKGGQPTRRMTKKETYDLYNNSGHEVAVHTYLHKHLECLPANIITKEILRDRENIEKMFGVITRGMAYPFGTYNDCVLECMSACGIAYSRTVRSTHGFNLPDKWYTLNPTCHHADPKLMELTEQFVSMEPRDYVDASKLFYLWGHSYEFVQNDNWEIIEEFAKTVGNRDDIWYATNIEIYDYVKAYENLMFSCDMALAKNPTGIDVWIMCDLGVTKIPAGETVKISK